MLTVAFLQAHWLHERLRVYISFKCGIRSMISWLCVYVCVCVLACACVWLYVCSGQKERAYFFCKVGRASLDGAMALIYAHQNFTICFQTKTHKILKKKY